jgi:hypothetical protein
MKRVKSVLKKIPGLLATYKKWKKWKYETLYPREIFRYDQKRLLSWAFCHNRTKEGMLAKITMDYHIVEKGLTMPNMRFGFGKAAILNLISQLNHFANTYGTEDPAFHNAVSVLAEYKQIHCEANYILDPDLEVALDELLKRSPISPSSQIDMTRDRYWQSIDAPFEIFSASRHSVRNFEGTISIEQIRNAIALANNAPSACNRQFVKVHCIDDHEMIARCFQLQNGNRGFGHLADKLLILTADLRDLVWPEERNDVFTNAGIYLMNLCYSLHRNKVAHCILNWSTPPRY